MMPIDQGGDAAVLRLEPLDDPVDGLHVVVLEAAARGRRSAASRSGSGRSRGGARSIRMRFSSRTSVERLAGDQLARRRRSGWPRSLSRHMPSALKFSRARPSGSIRLWQELHRGWLAVQLQRSRAGSGSRPLTALLGLLQRGDVRRRRRRGRAQDVVEDEQARASPARCGRVRRDRQDRPLVSTPPRGLSAGSVDPAHLVARRRPRCRSASPAAR